jgi:hypothetical protein
MKAAQLAQEKLQQIESQTVITLGKKRSRVVGVKDIRLRKKVRITDDET